VAPKLRLVEQGFNALFCVHSIHVLSVAGLTMDTQDCLRRLARAVLNGIEDLGDGLDPMGGGAKFFKEHILPHYGECQCVGPHHFTRRFFPVGY
jgi:hypothetical protein